jgi:2-methylfumaryl-CoA isomerase
LAAGSAATIPEDVRRPPQAAPTLGRDSEEVLATLLGLSAAEIAGLRDDGLVACA